MLWEHLNLMSEIIKRPSIYVYRRLLDVCNYINAKYYPNDRRDFFGFLTERSYIQGDGFIKICFSDYDNEEQWVKDFVQHLKEEQFRDAGTDGFTVQV